MKNILSQDFQIKLEEAIKENSYLNRIGVQTVEDLFSEKVKLSMVRESMVSGVGKTEYGSGIFFNAILSCDQALIQAMFFSVEDVQAMASLYPKVQF